MNNLFKALNDPTRRQILDLLRDGDLNAGDIAERLVVFGITLIASIIPVIYSYIYFRQEKAHQLN